MFSPARVTLSKSVSASDDDGPGGSTRPGQSLLEISTPHCISGGYLIYKIKLGYHGSGYNTLKIKCKSNSTAKINVDFDSMWSVIKDNGGMVKNEMKLDTFWNFDVQRVNGVELMVKTKPQATGQINIEGNCRVSKYSSGYIWHPHSLFSESYSAVELYFKNGGGPCYILPLLDGAMPNWPLCRRLFAPGARMRACCCVPTLTLAWRNWQRPEPSKMSTRR
ncbi:hypothetical protein SME22J_02590 [Serratia marcescens]|nr:hypothetical protein SME22J_02590 [Serratia marcescens]